MRNKVKAKSAPAKAGKPQHCCKQCGIIYYAAIGEDGRCPDCAEKHTAPAQPAQHTPTPWRCGKSLSDTWSMWATDNQYNVFDESAPGINAAANAAFAVRAVNAHEELLAALQDVLARVETQIRYADEGRTITRWTDKDGIAKSGEVANCDSLRKSVIRARAAIAKAEGTPMGGAW